MAFKVGPSGGAGGNPYDIGAAYVSGSYVIRVRVRSGAWVDCVELTVSDPRGVVTERAGGDGGDWHAFELGSGERIVRLSGRYTTYVDTITVHTSSGRVWTAGGSGGVRQFNYDQGLDASILRFHGGCGAYVDSIGVAGL
jgi:hypothetical protein